MENNTTTTTTTETNTGSTGSTGSTGANNTGNQGQTQTEETKTYTQEEVLALIQSETDKRVSQALKTQQKKYEKQLSLSKLDGDERAKAERITALLSLRNSLRSLRLSAIRAS